MTEPLNSGTVSTRLQRIAEMARERPEISFRSIHHVIDIELIEEAYRRTRKSGAVGVDGQTSGEYEKDLESNLSSLLERLKTGTYRAPPVRRVYIPKGDGKKTRPIGVPTFEDKVLQRTITMVLEAIYEQDFLSCSYGFRPGRSAHQALDALWKSTMSMGGGWLIDADVSNFFDALPHGNLRSFLDRRVTDGVIRRTIDKWLKAGALEDGTIRRQDDGSPQGGVVSPILANVYLHEVLDTWFEREVQPRLKGRSALVRYCDDFVVVCAKEEDARRVLKALRQRFSKYGLELHPDKTRMVYFKPPRGGVRSENDQPRPMTFDFLGFTHYWGRSRKGQWFVKRKTASSRFTRACRRINEWCRNNRHRPLKEQFPALRRKLLGHYNYYGIIGNARALDRFRYVVTRHWKKWLARRSNRPLNWQHFQQKTKRFLLPRPKVRRSVLRTVSESTN